MPFNEKNEWVNPPLNYYDKEDLERGYTVCGCGQGVRLHQAGFDAEMHMCGGCMSEVADADSFFKVQAAVEFLSK